MTPGLDDTVDELPARARSPKLDSGELTDPGRYARLGDEVLAELDQRLSLSAREREIAGATVELVAEQLARLPRARPDNQRLAQLEVRADATDAWRLRLTGVADGNGRIGTLERAIDDHREDTARALELIRIDVGPSAERKAEREAARLVATFVAGVKARMRWSLVISAVAVGASVWGWIGARSDARAAAAATAARTDTRLEFIERVLFRASLAPTPDPVRLP